MSKITGKFQVTLPKRLAETYGIKVGDSVEFVAAGHSIALLPARQAKPALDPAQRLRHFDRATDRQKKRDRALKPSSSRDRGWTREDLYARGRTR
jgi:AbrB family looped-hinge helix DNA binding protein